MWWVRRGDETLGSLGLSILERRASLAGSAPVWLLSTSDLGPDGCRELIRHVEGAATSLGATSLAWSTTGDEVVIHEVLGDLGYRTGAVQMRLRLTATDAGGGVELRPMTRERYDPWSVRSIAAYVTQVADSGLLPPDDARQKAERDFASLLPGGLDSPGARLWTAHDPEDGDEVGILWVGLTERSDGPFAYIYDIAVGAAKRRRGYGRGLMLAAHATLHAEGAAEMGLNVFGQNLGARALYDDLGYRAVATTFSRDLLPVHASG